MATIGEDILICSICMDVFENPKMLPCQHSFCNDCLLSFIQKKRTCVIGRLHSFHCPLCRHEVLLEKKDDVDVSFPTNYLLSTLLETRREDIYKPFIMTKNKSSEKHTQTVTKTERKKTRTLGTQIKRCKTANIAVQTKGNDINLQNRYIQTDESRLTKSINKGTQTVEPISSIEEDISTNQNVMKQSTTNENASNFIGHTLPEEQMMRQTGHCVYFIMIFTFLLLTVFVFRDHDFYTNYLKYEIEQLIEKMKQLNISLISNGYSGSFWSSNYGSDLPNGSELSFLGFAISLYVLLLLVLALVTEKLPLRPVINVRRWLRLERRRQYRRRLKRSMEGLKFKR
ncbi:uncharacterized protein LOC123564897 [Mercenaria mercenaria]|uniref:uncharacterized protein LOC123564897 n=1 Tax=Mercenaria mercenaria TaxID=6596 RepID=UPI00234EEF5B|nr:uncharacterized protein LOC123564897 [Mercenaria mercenaria]